jgi:DNA-binding XRE family transcriptional regulator
MSYPKVRGAIREKFGTQAAFAKALGINPSTLVKKLAGKVEWTVSEVQASAKLLGIPNDSITDYFFKD